MADCVPGEICDCPPETVECDDHCKALDNPVTIEELRATLEHYRVHVYLGGCAHGC